MQGKNQYNISQMSSKSLSEEPSATHDSPPKLESSDLKILILAVVVFLFYNPTSSLSKNLPKQPVHLMIPCEGIFLDVRPSWSLKQSQHQ